MELTAYQLVLLGDAHGFFHTGQHIHLQVANQLLVANDADNSALRAYGKVRLKPHRLQLAFNLRQIFISCIGAHYDNHVANLLLSQAHLFSLIRAISSQLGNLGQSMHSFHTLWGSSSLVMILKPSVWKKPGL